ncbi:unnamed protein product, partial [Ectocarpus sp. 4 AP-2014]
MAKKKATGGGKKATSGGPKGVGAAVEAPDKVPQPTLRRTTRSQKAAESADIGTTEADAVATQAADALIDLAGAAPPGIATAPGTPPNRAGGGDSASRSSQACKKALGHWSSTPPIRRLDQRLDQTEEDGTSGGLSQQAPAANERRAASGSGASKDGAARSGRGGATKSRPVVPRDGTSAEAGSSNKKARSGDLPPTAPRGGGPSSRTSASSRQKSGTAAGKPSPRGKKGTAPPKTATKTGVGEKVWLQTYPSTDLKIGEVRKDHVHMGIALLNAVAGCVNTVPDNKGFEDPAFKGYSERSWRMWKTHILVPCEANLRLNRDFQGDCNLFLNPGSFVIIQKYVSSQKNQYSKAQKNNHRGPGSAAQAKEATKPLVIAREKIWSGNKACRYPSSTVETDGEPLQSELSPSPSTRRAAGKGEGGGDSEDGGPAPPDYGPDMSEDDDQPDDDDFEKGFSQGTPPAGAMGGGGRPEARRNERRE